MRPLLKKGETIGVMSPAWWADEAALYKGEAILNTLGFEVDVHEQTALREGQVAGLPSERVTAFHELLMDENVHAIMFARGGYGSSQWVDLIDFNLVKKHPKPIIGFSDSTLLLNAIYAQTGLVTYHGPMLEWLGIKDSADTINHFIDILHGVTEIDLNAVPYRKGQAQGRLLGGNSTVWDQLIGTPYMPCEREDVVLFFEETSPARPNDIDKFICHMKNAGLFEKWNVVGLILDSMEDLKDNKILFGRTVEEIYAHHFPHAVMATRVKCGHGESMLTFPVGVQVSLTVENTKTELKIES